MVALINNGRYLEIDLEDIARIVAQTGIIMYDKVNGKPEEPPRRTTQEYDPERFTDLDTFDDDIPFPDEPPAY
jgi:hypothetical protein